MERRWVTGPRGEYLVVVYGDSTFRSSLRKALRGEGLPEMQARIDPFGVRSGLVRHAVLHGSRTGMVAVHAFGRRWAWVTPRGGRALAVGVAVVDLIENGAWVPEEMSQPDFPGATRTPAD